MQLRAAVLEKYRAVLSSWPCDMGWATCKACSPVFTITARSAAAALPTTSAIAHRASSGSTVLQRLPPRPEHNLWLAGQGRGRSQFRGGGAKGHVELRLLRPFRPLIDRLAGFLHAWPAFLVCYCSKWPFLPVPLELS